MGRAVDDKTHIGPVLSPRPLGAGSTVEGRGSLVQAAEGGVDRQTRAPVFEHHGSTESDIQGHSKAQRGRERGGETGLALLGTCT